MSEKIGTKKRQGSAKPVNPEIHDEFVALCSLTPCEMSEEEWALLQIHMGFCDSCQEKFLQYQKLVSDVIPAIAAVAAAERENLPDESPEALEAAERRLMSQLESSPTPQMDVKTSNFRWPQLPLLLAVGAVASACFIAFLFHGMATKPQSQGSHGLTALTPPIRQSVAPDEATTKALQRSDEEARNLRQQLSESENRLNQANQAKDQVQKQVEDEKLARAQIVAEKESLNQQLARAEAETASLKQQSTSSDANSDKQKAQVAELESKVRELQGALDEKDLALSEKDRMLALDKDFLAHDRDIRDLIGARNLYIADISDTNENGKTAKQFGRIFYTKDRSLIFYGFDLDSQVSRKQNVSFQVWGSGSDRPAPVNLGLFYQDDTHKRWVLRCNDAKSLARLDMVFVTVEPPGGSNRPTGKPLLRAYLQIHPNHP